MQALLRDLDARVASFFSRSASARDTRRLHWSNTSSPFTRKLQRAVGPFASGHFIDCPYNYGELRRDCGGHTPSSDPEVVSDPGLFGFYALVDRRRKYYLLVYAPVSVSRLDSFATLARVMVLRLLLKPIFDCLAAGLPDASPTHARRRLTRPMHIPRARAAIGRIENPGMRQEWHTTQAATSRDVEFVASLAPLLDRASARLISYHDGAGSGQAGPLRLAKELLDTSSAQHSGTHAPPQVWRRWKYLAVTHSWESIHSKSGRFPRIQLGYNETRREKWLYNTSSSVWERAVPSQSSVARRRAVLSNSAELSPQLFTGAPSWETLVSLAIWKAHFHVRNTTACSSAVWSQSCASGWSRSIQKQTRSQPSTRIAPDQLSRIAAHRDWHHPWLAATLLASALIVWRTQRRQQRTRPWLLRQYWPQQALRTSEWPLDFNGCHASKS